MGSMFFFQHSNLQIENSEHLEIMEETEHVSVFLGTAWDILGVPGSVFPPCLESTWGFRLAIGICCKLYASANGGFNYRKSENRARMAGNAGTPDLNIPSLSLPSHF